MLYLGSAHAPGKGPLIAVTGKGEPMANQDGALSGLKGLVVLDGNWAQAKALWWRNAWLTKLRRFVVVPDGPSLYGNLRKEARPDAVSTLEAVGLPSRRWKAATCASACWHRSATCSPRPGPRASGAPNADRRVRR